MDKRILAGACALVLAVAGADRAQAATASTVMPVTATVLAVCTVVALPLVFGNYSGTQLDMTTTLNVLCTPSVTYTVRLDAGTASGATVTTRKMGLLTATLGYSLYRDAGRTQNWGITDGTDTAGGTGSGLLQPFTVYGRIPAAQYPGLGAYVDSVGVTVAY